VNDVEHDRDRDAALGRGAFDAPALIKLPIVDGHVIP